MGLPTITQLVAEDRISVVPYFSGTKPIGYTIDSDNVAAAGAGTLTLSLNTVDGGAASTEVLELEDDSEFFIASSTTVAASAVAGLGSRTANVDDAAGAVPTDLVAEGDFISFAGHEQRYLVTFRKTNANDYEVRLDPALKAAVADDEAVTVYNIVRLNLGADDQFVKLTTTGQAIGVSGVKYPIGAAEESLTVYPMRQLLGITDISPSPAVASTEVTDMKSKANIQGSTTLDITISANEFPRNSGLAEVVLPSLLDTGDESIGIYFIYENQDGKRIHDTGSFTASAGSGGVEAARTYEVTISANLGDNFERWQP